MRTDDSGIGLRRLPDGATSLLLELSSTRGRARIGRRSRALWTLAERGLVFKEYSGDPRRPWWPLTELGRRVVARERQSRRVRA
jgi:hypothetical protein